MKPEYIIVHHTGAEEKNAEQVKKYHLSLGWKDVGYNFIIERDGRVVEGRSIAITGAHCKANGMNYKSIGIALIGNLTKHSATQEQIDSLYKLITRLMTEHMIPAENILGHGEVPGALTSCPGDIDMDNLRNVMYGNNFESPRCAPEWQEGVITQAMDEGLISQRHEPGDVATKWFVLEVCLKLLRKIAVKL